MAEAKLLRTQLAADRLTHETTTRHRSGIGRARRDRARRSPRNGARAGHGVHSARGHPSLVLTPTEEKTHEALLLPRRLLAIAAHRRARSGYQRRAEEGQHERQVDGWRRRLLAGQSERLRPAARPGQRGGAPGGSGDGALPRRPEAGERLWA